MKLTLTISGFTILFGALSAFGQEALPEREGVPIYSVTVIERTTQAINYEYRTGPTRIDFRGTVLLPSGKGEATVESLRGRTEIDAKFENLTPPARYGPEYLTYTLWAITPQGAAHNLGEVVPDGSDKARLRVTTGLQAFGLIVTAEPYSTTRQPGDVVVLENQVRPDTVGKIQPIQAKYELMPRGHYTWAVPQNLGAPAGPKVSMDKYETVLEVYEAQNAVGIARAAGADRYAADTFQKAQGLLNEAENLQSSKAPLTMIVQDAREAAQTAEDARSIAERRRQEETIANAKAEAARAQQAQVEAQNGARQARVEADAARAQAEADRSALERAQADAAEARMRAEQAETAAAQAAQPAAKPALRSASEAGAQKAELRRRLFEQLSGVMAMRDTPRGLVATIPDSAFTGSELRGDTADQLSRFAAIMASYPNLHTDVEGYTDSPATAATAWSRAESVQHVLLEEGLATDRVSARGLGDSRPLVANSSAAGRVENRRVEIVISGAPIGNLPYWDRTYSLAPGGTGPQ